MCNQNDKIEKKIKSIIIKNSPLNCKENDINDISNLVDDLGFDSIEIMQLIMDIENEFIIHFEDDFLLIETIAQYKILKEYVINIMSKKEVCEFGN